MTEILICYKVKLPVTNRLQDTYRTMDGEYLGVEYGILYVLGYSMLEVGERFPDAIGVERMGPGYLCGFGVRE